MNLGYKDPRWQQKRLQQFELAGWKCQECGSKKNELNLHHYWYEKDNEVWDYPDECFVVLCDGCHVAWHARKRQIDHLLAFSLSEMDQAFGLLCGLRCATYGVDFQFTPNTDALTASAVVRGFWPPLDYQRLLIDGVLKKIANGDTFFLSNVVCLVIPIDEPEFAFIAKWFDNAIESRCRRPLEWHE